MDFVWDKLELAVAALAVAAYAYIEFGLHHHIGRNSLLGNLLLATLALGILHFVWRNQD